MKKFWLVLPILAASALFAAAQDPRPVPTPPPADDSDVVRISTDLIQIDVTVTDSKGRLITDLRPDELEIFENDKKQKISNFSFISGTKPAGEKHSPKDKITVPRPVTEPRPEMVQRTIALVVDDLTLSFESTYQVRQALKKFVNEQMQDGDLVAIIRTGAGVGALQQFTTDKRLLYAAIERVRWNNGGMGQIAAFGSMPDKVSGVQPEGPDRDFDDFRESVFATGTLGAINYIIRGMRDLPGRKSIMLLSDGIHVFTGDTDGYTRSGRVMESLRRLVDMANRASVVIYTMDARGLQIGGVTAADDTSGWSAGRLERSMNDRRNSSFSTQEGLLYLASQTGGFGIVNNNDLSGGIRRVLDNQSYYLVGFQPDGDTFDPRARRFNKLEVKVTRPGLKVRYRSGFFGVSDENIQKPKMTSEQRLVSALTSPFAVNDVSLRLNALFGNDTKGSFIHSMLHIRGRDLTVTREPGGGGKAVFDILAVGFGDNGLPIDQISMTYTLTVKNEVYKDFIKNGFVYEFLFPVKKAGAYQLRVALHDHGTGKIGSANQFVEVPDIKKHRLVLSGAYLENLPFADWSKRRSRTAAEVIQNAATDPLSDTSLRQFKRGTVLNYGFTVFNSKLDTDRKPKLSMQTKVFCDGKMIFEGAWKPITYDGQTDLQRINILGSLNLGSEIQTGDYILQITVRDELAKEKQQTTDQFIQFEIVE